MRLIGSGISERGNGLVVPVTLLAATPAALVVALVAAVVGLV